ncbi:MAG: phosphotransferase [Caldilineaceae bacterium]
MTTLTINPTHALDQQQQLAQAFSAQQMGPMLRNALSPASWPKAVAKQSTRSCHILDAKVDPNGSGTMLYQLDAELVLGVMPAHAEHRQQPERAPTQAVWLPEIGMYVYPFLNDPALPALRTALDGQQMAARLNAELPTCRSGEQRILRCRATLLRYRPGRRCTLRYDLRLVDRSGVISSRTLFGKLYHDCAKAQAVYAEMQRLAACTQANGAPVTLAHAEAFLSELPLIVQAPVSGQPLDLAFEHAEKVSEQTVAEIRANIRAAAVALAAVHKLPTLTQRQRPVDADLAKLTRRAQKLAGEHAALGTQMSKLATTLAATVAQLAGENTILCTVHGDCKPSQFLVGGAQIALLDFDHCGLADPASDVGMFLATLRQISVRNRLRPEHSTETIHAPTWLTALEEEFLAAYMTASGAAADFRRRATWYQALALLRKALRGFARSPYSPLPAQLITAAERCLASDPA